MEEKVVKDLKSEGQPLRSTPEFFINRLVVKFGLKTLAMRNLLSIQKSLSTSNSKIKKRTFF